MQIPYGPNSMSLEFEQGRRVEVVSPKAVPPRPDAIRRSLLNPVDFEDLESFLSRKHRILVVVNDHTRSTPTDQVLRELNLREKEVTTLIASGSHRAPSAAEIEEIIGGKAPRYGGTIAVHDCRDANNLRRLGRTSRGTEVYLNSLLFDADGIITVGSVEPHYFGGFTGGRKFLLPALAGFESIEMNHSLAAQESSRLLALDGNPVHDDFMEALEMFGRFDRIFSIQLVLNHRSEVSYAYSGHIVKSFDEAVVRAKEIYVPRIERKARIVISVNEPPLDMDLYQTQKAIDNVKLAVEDGGIIILVSSCREGIGDDHFYKLLTSDNAGVGRENAHKFGYHKAVKLTNLLKHASIFAVTNLPPSIPKSIGFTPYSDVQEALKGATRIMGNESEILVVMNAANTVPLPKTA
jgi:nickel-dependent lactate racemase